MARTPATEYFGSELRRAREAAGLSREEFGKLVNYASSTIGAYETGERFPSRSLAAAADEHLKTDGLFGRMLEKLLTGYVHPDWFRPWSDIEQHATAIRTYQPYVIPGLLQTEAYAREILGDEERVAARMARKQIFTKPKPPKVVAVIDEALLRRPVGGPETMREQLLHLAEGPACVQVVPLDGGTYFHLDGPFALATADGRDYLHLDTPVRGFVLDGAEIVSQMWFRWDAVRGEALPPWQSRELILEVAQTWTSGG